MILLSPVIYPTLKQLLSKWLQTALDDYIAQKLVLVKQPQGEIIHKAKDCQRVLYVSKCAVQHSRGQNIPALEIAQQLGLRLRQVVDANYAWASSYLQNLTSVNLLTDISVQVLPSGLIYFELTERGIALWLQYLINSPPMLQHSAPPDVETQSLPSLFAVQYAHARCCSLLRLAAREKLITLEVGHGLMFLAVAPDPLPWLEDGKLRTFSPQERALITQLFGLLDHLYSECDRRSKINWQKAALALTQTWENFYNCCRIWGEVKTDNINLAQARLGLLLIVQRMLCLLLQEKLDIFAPLEL